MTYEVKPDGIFCFSLRVEADAASFQVLDTHYAKDAQHVYFDGVVIDEAKPLSFKVLGAQHGTDGTRVFWRTRVVAGADPAWFRALGSELGVDQRAVYDCVRTVSGADPATFEVLDESYARDAKHVYRNGQVVEGLKPSDFGSWGKFRREHDRCTYDDGELPGAKAASFRGLSGDWARDEVSVFFRRQRVDADAASFEVMGVAFGKDARQTYLGAQPFNEPVDPAWLTLSFEECSLRRSARKGDSKAMLALARMGLETMAGIEPLLWASLAEAFGAKRPAAVLRDGWALVDPHEEVPELRADVPHQVAVMLKEGRAVPAQPELAEKWLSQALQAGLLRLTQVTRDQLVECFGEASVRRAEDEAERPKPKRRKQ